MCRRTRNFDTTHTASDRLSARSLGVAALGMAADSDQRASVWDAMPAPSLSLGLPSAPLAPRALADGARRCGVVALPTRCWTS